MVNISKLFPRLSIRWKLIIGFVLIGAVPSLVAGAFGIWSTTSRMAQSVLENIRRSVVTKAEDVQAFVERVESDVMFLSRLPTVRGVANAVPGSAEHGRWIRHVGEAFIAFSRTHGAYYQVRYLDATGREMARVDFDGVDSHRIPATRLQDKADRYYFTEGMRTPVGQVYVSPMDLNIEHGSVEVPRKAVVRFATVVPNRAGQPRGLVIINVYATYILQRIQKLRGIEGGVVFLANQEGHYLSRSDRIAAGGDFFEVSPENTLERDLSPAMAKHILSGQSGTAELRGRVVAYAPVLTGLKTRGNLWVLGHIYPRREIFAGVRTTEAMVVGFGLLVLLVAITAGLLGARQLTAPLLALSRSAGVIAQGDFDHRIRLETNDELEDLSRQFNQMAAHLKEHERELLDARERAEWRAQEAQALSRIGTEISSLLSLPRILQLVVDKARELLKADLAILCLEEPGGGLRVGAVSGSPEVLSLRPGELVETMRCAKAAFPEGVCPVARNIGLPTHVGIPLRSGERMVGNLCVGYRVARAVGQDELAFLDGLGNQAAIAIENARLHREVRELAALEERERIGQDLHDGIIQAIYATGLGLEECVRLAEEEPQEIKPKLEAAIEGLNTVIRDVRNYIVGREPEQLQDRDLGRALGNLVRGIALNALLRTDVTVPDGIHGVLGRDQVNHLFHISREALTNVVRHAQASRVSLRLGWEDGLLLLVVEDDGVGFDAHGGAGIGQGLRNMGERARRLGGECTVSSAPGQGTRITVRLPVEQAP